MLGVPQILHDGAPVPFRAPQRALVLLAYLAVSRVPVPRKRAAFALWPDHPEEAAQANLRRHLALLESTLPAPGGEPWLRKDRLSIQWVTDGDAVVDAARFAVLSTDPNRYADAVALYAGEFLESIADDEWVIAHREHLHDRQLAMLSSLVATHRGADPKTALDYALRAYRLDPWREDVVRDVMALRRNLGDVAGAMAEFAAFRKRLVDELGVEPMVETAQLAEAIAAQTAVAETSEEADEDARFFRAPNNLPRQLGPIVGRDALIEDVRASLERTSLVTLTGTGGVGKTRAALHVAGTFLGTFSDGVWFVDLAPLRSGDLVASAVASTLGIVERKDTPIVTTLVRSLAQRRLLIVLDNCEHVIDAAAELAGAILRECLNVAILATSREALNLAGEQVHLVAPLDFPGADVVPTATEVERFDAVVLFADRARAADARFRVTDENAADVAEVCRRLDGIPLAIELAAARVKALGMRPLLDRLAQRFAILTGGRREALPRQQTLRALIDWSHDLLSERERIAFRRFAVFVGGWSLDAACAVCAGEEFGASEVLDLLASLVNKSLVVAEEQGGTTRYRFLESTRQYALAQLESSREGPATARRHLECFVDVARRFEASWLTSPDAECFALIIPELDNVRAALEWSIAGKHDVPLGAVLAVACERLWTIAFYLEGRRWLTACLAALDERRDADLVAQVRGVLFQVMPDGTDRPLVGERAIEALRAVGDEATLSRVLPSYGHLIGQMGRIDEGIAAVSEGLEISRRFDDARDTANALTLLAVLEQRRGDLPRARTLSAEAAALLETIGSPSGRAYVLYVLAEIEFTQGDASAALARATEAQELLRSLRREARVLGMNCGNMAAYAVALGDLPKAEQLASEAIAHLREMHDLLVWPVETMAVIYGLKGELERSARLLGFTESIVHRLGLHRGPTERAGHDRLVTVLSERLASDVLSHCLADGAKLTAAQAIACAIEDADCASERIDRAASTG